MRTQDELEIRNLITRYNITTDNADVDGFMSTWVSPEEFEGYNSGPFGYMKTWEDLRNFEAEHVKPGGGANGMRHQATNIYIEFTNDKEALVTHDMLVLAVDNPPMIVATGRYNNSKVVKTDKGWKFKYRSLELDKGFTKLMEQQGMSIEKH